MHRIFDVVGLVVIAGIIFVLVRPGSQGPKLVGAVGESATGLLKAATGGGSWN